MSGLDDHQLVVELFMRCMGVIYCIAFLSLGVQVTGLVGENGILPVGELLDFVRERHPELGWFYLPTLFWLDHSDLALQLACLLGAALAVMLVLGRQSVWIRIALFALYLSLFHAGQTFLSFQWDSLLLEAGFLLILLSRRPAWLLLWLFHWLLFRLRFMSGVAKLASGDPVWANLTTLNYYFETQPLPHWGAWYFHQFPEWLLLAGTLFVFFTELIVPLLIFLPRRFRLAAAAITISMQLVIIATSNHNWINLLTILLCLFLLDDRALRTLLPAFLSRRLAAANAANREAGLLHKGLLLLVSLLVVTGSVTAFTHKFTPVSMPTALNQLSGYTRSWGIGHIFHLFPSMQTERHELQIEGSNDGRNWQAYGFRYKPGALAQRPAVVLPHHPRLDWMMWFVPPQHPHMLGWFDSFMVRLQQGQPEVLELLAFNPFAAAPPKYLRVQVFRYRFTTAGEREQTGDWWAREYLGQFPHVRPRMP